MNCLRCSHAMSKQRSHGVLVDRCPGCGGIWLDAGELKGLLSRARRRSDRELELQERSERAAERARTVDVAGLCPRCQQPLLPSITGGVEVDRCRHCGGLFFDGGELRLLVQHRAGESGRLRQLWRRLWGVLPGRRTR